MAQRHVRAPFPQFSFNFDRIFNASVDCYSKDKFHHASLLSCASLSLLEVTQLTEEVVKRYSTMAACEHHLQNAQSANEIIVTCISLGAEAQDLDLCSALIETFVRWNKKNESVTLVESIKQLPHNSRCQRPAGSFLIQVARRELQLVRTLTVSDLKCRAILDFLIHTADVSSDPDTLCELLVEKGRLFNNDARQQDEALSVALQIIKQPEPRQTLASF